MELNGLLNRIDAEAAERALAKMHVWLNLVLVGVALVAVGIHIGKPEV